MRYLPKSPADRKEMLAEIGVASIDDLFSTIPAEYRLTRDLDVPRQHGEQEVIERAMQAAEENTGRAPVLLIRHRQCGGIEPAVGPMIVVGVPPEIIDAHRGPSRSANVSLIPIPKW